MTRQMLGVSDDQPKTPGHQQPAERRKCLRVTQHVFALRGIGKQLGKPGHGGHELDAHADKRRAAQNEQHFDRRGKSGRKCRKGIKQDAPGQHAASPEPVGQIAAQQAEQFRRRRPARRKVSRAQRMQTLACQA